MEATPCNPRADRALNSTTALCNAACSPYPEGTRLQLRLDFIPPLIGSACGAACTALLAAARNRRRHHAAAATDPTLDQLSILRRTAATHGESISRLRDQLALLSHGVDQINRTINSCNKAVAALTERVDKLHIAAASSDAIETLQHSLQIHEERCAKRFNALEREQSTQQQQLAALSESFTATVLTLEETAGRIAVHDEALAALAGQQQGLGIYVSQQLDELRTAARRLPRPQVAQPQVAQPQAQAPGAQAPQPQAPGVQAPQPQAPQAQAPQARAPGVRAPEDIAELVEMQRLAQLAFAERRRAASSDAFSMPAGGGQ